MDREDWLYLGGSGLAAVGLSLWFLPLGIVYFGVSVVLWPFVARMLGGRK